MARREYNDMILWPEYFDSSISRKKGRRVSKELSVASPSCEDIFNVCRRLSLNPELEKGRAHPSRWYDPKGRVKVMKKFSKSETIIKVAKALSSRKK